jgi:putative SOS response-associated peptidase YedK
MCGRFYLDVARDKLKAHYRLKQVPRLVARFNIAPSQNIAAIRESEQGRELAMLHWGLIPSWAKDDKAHYSMINARAETVASKPAYRAAFRQRRCLIPVSGFYEWHSQDHDKQPYVVQMQDDEPFSLAGLWEHWQGENGNTIESCTIVVTDANALLRPIHDRMPVIIATDDYETWLDPEIQDTKVLNALLYPYPAEYLQTFPVSRVLNNPTYDNPSCIEPIKLD